ncbi:MAG: hypothetical protein U1E27_07650, partial [Kiritimatiellia bacterium]|nr:hypothetical protein [Kiritimatiellia bacterium]
MKRMTWAAIVTFGAALAWTTAQAQSVWTNSAGGIYHDPANWNPNTVPAAANVEGRFTGNDTFTVTFTQSVTAAMGRHVGNATTGLQTDTVSVTFDLGGLTHNYTHTSTMQISANGTLTLIHGTLNQNYQLWTGYQSGGPDTISRFVVGTNAVLNHTTANATRLGYRRHGEVIVKDGGAFSSAAALQLGWFETSSSFATAPTGRVVVTGSGSWLTSGTTTLGYQGVSSVGILEVSHGGSVTNTAITMREGSGHIRALSGGLIVSSGAINLGLATVAGSSIHVDGGRIEAAGSLNLTNSTFSVVLNAPSATPMVSAESTLRVNETDKTTLQIALGSGFDFGYNDKYTLLSYGSLGTHYRFADSLGNLYNTGDTLTVGGQDFELSYADGGNLITLTAIPEPGTLGL